MVQPCFFVRLKFTIEFIDKRLLLIYKRCFFISFFFPLFQRFFPGLPHLAVEFTPYLLYIFIYIFSLRACCSFFYKLEKFYRFHCFKRWNLIMTLFFFMRS